MSEMGPACVKTCPSRECAELFSLFFSFDGDRQSGSFVIERNRRPEGTAELFVGSPAPAWPASVQHGRVMLYATYFFFGAGIGVQYLDRGLLAADGRMAKVSWDWLMMALVPYCLLWVLIYIKREILGNPEVLPDWYEGIYAVCFTGFSVAIMFLI